MKKTLVAILLGIAMLGIAAQPAFADSFWKQNFTQLSTEDLGLGAVGAFDSMSIIWQDKTKFTSFAFSDFKTLASVADADWTINNYSDVFASASSSTLKTGTKFSINFGSTLKPTGTDFYFGLFKNGAFIGGQDFQYDGSKWESDAISASDWNTAAASVTPEPISTTLFLLGGAALGTRKFLKKKK